MGADPTLKTAAASLVALALALTAFTTPAAASQAPTENLNTETTTEPNCYQIYLGEHQAGPVTVDASDSCVEVTIDETQGHTPVCIPLYAEGSLGPADFQYDGCGVTVTTDAEPSLEQTNCIQVYIEAEAGPATYTYSCSSGGNLTVDEDWSPEDETPTSSSNCFYIYYQKEAGPVTVTVTSTCSASVSVDEDWRP